MSDIRKATHMVILTFNLEAVVKKNTALNRTFWKSDTLFFGSKDDCENYANSYNGT